MTLVCIDRPNRTKPRLYKANDIGRIFCLVLEQGTPRREIIRAINVKCPDADVCDCLPVKGVLTKLLELLREIVNNILGPLNLAVVVVNALVIRIPVLRRIPAIRRLLMILNRIPAISAEIEATRFIISEVLEEFDPEGIPVLPDADF